MCFAAIGPVIGAMGSIIGAVVGAAGAQQQAEAQARKAEYEAKVAINNATQAAYAGTFESERIAEKGERELGAQRAAYAKSGVLLGTGTPITAFADSFSAMQGDIEEKQFEARSTVIKWQDQAKLHEMEAANAREAGRIAATSAIISGFTGIAGALKGPGTSLLV